MELGARAGVEELMERLGEVLDVERVDEDCGGGDEMGERTGDAGDDGGAGGHGFEDGETESFVE